MFGSIERALKARLKGVIDEGRINGVNVAAGAAFSAAVAVIKVIDGAVVNAAVNTVVNAAINGVIDAAINEERLMA